MTYKAENIIPAVAPKNGDTFSIADQLPKTGAWQQLAANLQQIGSTELQGRKQDIERFLKENGVTYNIYNHAAGAQRLWELDPIPYVIEQQEWEVMTRGLQQRAQLLNLVLQDIYGPQRLLKEGMLPTELVYRHQGFLRPCTAIPQAYQQGLVVYSANTARGIDGRTWVISDRVQAPSGSGYALENRLAITRMVPELFQGIKVSRLSPFFETLDQSLQHLAGARTRQPRIVILTPGPNNETYFEHSYLSSYLGYTLVQGSDLMVKDRTVWLKTIGGLEKVDVILRRVDDWYCDPLELKEDSLLGVPGLLQAVRAGQVSIANPLGCGILESPGLMPFLQGISQFFLQEDLHIPNIASWWCGQPKELQYVLDHLPQLVIKKIHRATGMSTAEDGSTKSTAELEVLKKQILQHPWLYVGQEKVLFYPTPTFEQGKIYQRNALFRVFLVKHNDGFVPMEGGLTSTNSDTSKFLISNQLGGFSKDTWVIAAGSQAPMAGKEITAAPVAPVASMLPSKTAESLFWVGRYGERLLGSARIMRVVMQFVTDSERLLDEEAIQYTEKQLLRVLTHYTCTYPGFVGKGAEEKFEHPWPELTDVLQNAQRTGGVHYNLR
ncbi:MAG TPA: circularly permuted type 2 ATP-grasp protein, partial [Phnomibacter sp.]|nr:circularly permuted type 2 ATP-grasp protein [Phnomibacter sp.]